MAHRVAPEARADLDELWYYVAGDRSIETADRLVDSITARFFLLARHPHRTLIGRTLPGAPAPLRIGTVQRKERAARIGGRKHQDATPASVAHVARPVLLYSGG